MDSGRRGRLERGNRRWTHLKVVSIEREGTESENQREALSVAVEQRLSVLPYRPLLSRISHLHTNPMLPPFTVTLPLRIPAFGSLTPPTTALPSSSHRCV